MPAAPLSSPFIGTLHDVLSWWRMRMLELLPRRFAPPDPSVAPALLVVPENGRLLLLRRRNGAEQPAGEVDAADGASFETRGEDGRGIAPGIAPGVAPGAALGIGEGRRTNRREAVLLRLPPGAVLVRPVTLPLAAEGALDGVLRFEMDRLTPFNADDVLFGWRDLRRDREAGRLLLTLLLVPRAPLAPTLAALDAAGLSPDALEAPLPGLPAPVRIPLRDRERRGRPGRMRTLLILAVVLLAVAIAALPFLWQGRRLAALDEERGALRPAVAEAQLLRARIAGSGAGAAAVAAERNRLGDALAVLAATTRVLPDDTFLSDLTLRDGTLTISGQSSTGPDPNGGGRGAAQLIPAMSGDPNFSNPSFAAPVTRMDNNNSELFSIRAGVGHEPDAAGRGRRTVPAAPAP
ncbi:PilN domain-containing protein [Rhizosaccharibacter radicis]|uniref:PilN domain-containing protein n=1 Tax=Rhizosaccharibacter radicis TaxID=2782605 RepID=A0ABT1VT37_9PROT|nr:PilN domain-containing protein [Acetobacteraceae bacterium KSS12]